MLLLTNAATVEIDKSLEMLVLARQADQPRIEQQYDPTPYLGTVFTEEDKIIIPSGPSADFTSFIRETVHYINKLEFLGINEDAQYEIDTIISKKTSMMNAHQIK